MERRRVVAMALGAVTFVAVLGPARAGLPEPAGSTVGDQMLVRWRDGATQAERDAALAEINGEVVRTITFVAVDVVRIPLKQAMDFSIARMRRGGAVQYAEPDVVGRIALSPDDTCAPPRACGTARQWNLGAVNAQAGWDVVPGTFYKQADKKLLTPVKVAVLDTQIDRSLPDWVNAQAGPSNAPWDAREGGQLDVVDAWDAPNLLNAGPAAYHGSFVAGIIGAATNNAQAIAGLGYHAQIMPVAVVDGQGNVRASDLAEGIGWAWSHGARVINLSLGLSDYSTTVQNAIIAASRPPSGKPGALVVAAAGNNANDAPFYPAQMTGVMAVSAVDEADRPGACTNHNAKISVGAPGVGILSLSPASATGLAVIGCGTSTAAPHVSALSALLFAQSPDRTPQEVRDVIERSADDADSARYPGPDEYFGRGRLNFQRALLDGSGLAVVDQLRATIPRALGGSSQATAIGKAAVTKQIVAAEWFVDRLGEPGTGGTLTAADGAFDSSTEVLTATIPVSLDVSTGVHRLFLRAMDADGWGPASTTALIVDRTPPQVTDLTATTAIPAADQPSQISFNASDDYSTAASYSIKVTRSVLGASQVVYESGLVTIPLLPATVRTTWKASLTDVGTYTIYVTAFDEGINPKSATAQILVL